MKLAASLVTVFLFITSSCLALDIYVSQSNYDLIVADNGKALFNCKVGLGSRAYPTPTGDYYILYIYDNDPWWIPPNRPWAYGKRSSKSVYGGTMAPLLRKTKPRTLIDGEDYIALECEFRDHDYRFHGTQQPFSIGRNQSHGCVRMLPKDAKAVADIIKERVGICSEGETPNGKFVVLCSPVKLTIVR